MVDEQHRFGVHQRLALGAKGAARRHPGDDRDPDPAHPGADRFGDMDVSVLDEKPPGRKPIETRTISARAHRRGGGGVGAALAGGEQAYWVCPLVAESEIIDLAAAEERFEALRRVFGEPVGLVHGRMRARTRTPRWSASRRGETRSWSPPR